MLLAVSTAFGAQQELVRGNGAEPQTLDPTLGEGVPGAMIRGDLFEPLMRTDRAGKVVLGQAASYTISKDQKVYTFKIRKDAVWSNGDKVTAGDFEYSFKRAADPKTAAPYSWYIQILGIENGSDIVDGKKAPETMGVKALDDETLQITLTKPIPYFLKGLAHGTMAPIPQKTVKKFGNKWTQPANIVTNGAYQLKEWVVNEKIVLVKSDKYYDNEKVSIDKVTYLPIPEFSTEYNRYKAGEIDVSSSGISSSIYKQMKKEHPEEIHTYAQLGTYYYYLNMKKKPFDDIRVRKALSYAINRNLITEKILGGGQIPAYTFVPDGTDGYIAPKPEYMTWTQKQRDEAAIKLMTEAGITADKPLAFELLYNTSENHKKIALAIASMWKKAFNGAVKVTLKNQEWKTYIAEKKAGNYQVARAGWVGDYNEPSTMLDLLTKGHSSNNSFYDNPEYDKRMNAARTVLDDAKRNALYAEADKLIAQDMPIIPIYNYVTNRLVKPYVKGYPTSNPLDKLKTQFMSVEK
jgi:oligopeptide transport system substrate-binding protein